MRELKTPAAKRTRWAKRWSVVIDQRDEDQFHGTHSWLGGVDLREELMTAIDRAEEDAYSDTRKIVITLERESL